MYKFIIPGRLIGLNEYVRICRGNKYAAAKAKKDIESSIMTHIHIQLRGVKISKKIYIVFHWYEKNSKRDLDNVSFAKKFILDSLVKSGTIPNDGWKNIAGFEDHFFVDKENPRIEIFLREV